MHATTRKTTSSSTSRPPRDESWTKLPDFFRPGEVVGTGEGAGRGTGVGAESGSREGASVGLGLGAWLGWLKR